MSREVRLVKAGWEHPKRANGLFEPLLGRNFSEALSEYNERSEQWENGFKWSWSEDKYVPRSEDDEREDHVDSEPPHPENYMPEWSNEEKTRLMMYETTSEGTPISPPFKTPEELAEWLTDNSASAFASMTATYEEWLSMIKRGYSVCSGVMTNQGIMSGVAAVSKLKRNEENINDE